MIDQWLCKMKIHKWTVQKTSEGIWGYIHYRKCERCQKLGVHYEWR